MGIPMATRLSGTKGTFLRTGPRRWTSQTVLPAYEVTPRLSVRCWYHAPIRGKGSKAGHFPGGTRPLEHVPHPKWARDVRVVVSPRQPAARPEGVSPAAGEHSGKGGEVHPESPLGDPR